MASLMAGAIFVTSPAVATAPGEELYEAKCGGCHSVTANRVGPMHRDVVGRQPGTVADYKSSEALKKLGGVWTPERLDRWLQGPQALAPGTRMYFTVPDARQRLEIIGYLESVSKHSKP